MKKRLKQDIKRILDALASQHESEFLSYPEKLKSLGLTHATRNTADSLPLASTRSINRVAWITDGSDQSLDYALEVCSRQQAELDLVLHGKALTDVNGVNALQSSVSNAGIAHHSIVLKGSSLKELTDYIGNHANLIYLVASIGNPLAHALSENMSVASKRMNIPLVLCGERKPQAMLQS